VVAWDALCDPAPASVDPCAGGAPGSPPGRRVPSLSLSADSFFGTAPEGAPDSRARASRAFSAAGLDSGSITIRGGTHFEFSYIPLQLFRATLRGMDLASWYTTAWFDRYVKGDRRAVRRLLSDRWRHDPGDAVVDPAGGGNLLSRAFTSRLDIQRADGRRVICEDLRAGCPGLRPSARDGAPPRYSYLAHATAPDGR
jgi:hypothetical protein